MPMSDALQVVLAGGTGFTGRALMRRLAAEPSGQVQVHALVRGQLGRVAGPDVRVVLGDLSSMPEAALAQLFPKAPHVLVHLASHNVGTAADFQKVNVEGTRRLMAVLPASCMGIVHGSSLSVLGQSAQEGVDEQAPTRPQTPLACSRLAAEQLVLEAAQSRGIGAYCLRPRFVLGRGDAATLPGLLRLAQRGLAVGSGRQQWSVIDVDDYAEILLALCRRLQSGAISRGPLHVGYSRPISFDEVRQVLSTSFELPALRWRLPVSHRVTRSLACLPLDGLKRLATQLELVGLSHYASTQRLRAELGAAWQDRDPRAVVARAARWLTDRPPAEVDQRLPT